MIPNTQGNQQHKMQCVIFSNTNSCHGLRTSQWLYKVINPTTKHSIPPEELSKFKYNKCKNNF